MAKLEVTKTIEARKLNPRTRQLLAQPPTTIPFGAILDQIVENGENIEFMYLRDLYECKGHVLRVASQPIEGSLPGWTSTSTAAGAAPAPEPVTFVWERLKAGSERVSRAKLPGGWLIATGDPSARSLAFYPDPEHAWDGTTL